MNNRFSDTNSFRTTFLLLNLFLMALLAAPLMAKDKLPEVSSDGLHLLKNTKVRVASAGQMTLYLELYDSETSTLLARVIDPQAAREGGIAKSAWSSIPNGAPAWA